MRSGGLNYPDVAAQIRLPVYAHNAPRNVQSTILSGPLPHPFSSTSIAITPGGRGRNLCTYVCSLCAQRLGTYWPIRTAGSKINSPLRICSPLAPSSLPSIPSPPLPSSTHDSLFTLFDPVTGLLLPLQPFFFSFNPFFRTIVDDPLLAKFFSFHLHVRSCLFFFEKRKGGKGEFWNLKGS